MLESAGDTGAGELEDDRAVGTSEDASDASNAGPGADGGAEVGTERAPGVVRGSDERSFEPTAGVGERPGVVRATLPGAGVLSGTCGTTESAWEAACPPIGVGVDEGSPPVATTASVAEPTKTRATTASTRRRERELRSMTPPIFGVV